MLIQLEIKNFAIIKHSIVNFENGFNVITGETGAGKSIILDALSTILGGRTSKGIVRKGEESSELKAVFLKSETLERKLKDIGIVTEDEVVVVKRVISKNGRSVVRINESIQTIQTLRYICEDLIELSGQKEYQTLFDEDKYIYWLDQYGTQEHHLSLNTYQQAYQEYLAVSKRIDEIQNSEREKEQLLDLYKFQKEEIESVNLKIGEDEELENERKFLSSFEVISKNTGLAVSKFEVVEEIFVIKNLLEAVSKHDVKMKEFTERLERVYYELDDISSEVSNYLDSIEYDEYRLNEIMSRINTIHNLKRKYADSIEGILDHLNEVSEKISLFENKEAVLNELMLEQNSLLKVMQVESEKLHQFRTDIAAVKSAKITSIINELCMPDSIFKFECEVPEKFNSYGKTKVKIMFNANKGEDLQLLTKVASGGELSRVLLAMKIADDKNQELSTLIFDEIDEGIGGEVGRVIGEKLLDLSKNIQVIAISHLPQVAAKADYHFLINKKTEEDRTLSEVEKLTYDQRKIEIARMIYGNEQSEITLKQAEEMLRK